MSREAQTLAFCVYARNKTAHSNTAIRKIGEDHHLVSRGLSSDEKKVISWDIFFYPTLIQIIDSFSCSPLNFLF